MQILCIVLGVTVVILVALILALKSKVARNTSLRDYVRHVNNLLEYKKVEFDSLQADYVQLQKECAELRVLAHYDSLTGLLNRRTYDETIKRFKASMSGGENNRKHGLNSVGLIIFDVDHFKQVNDNFGHHVGDEVLKEIAEAIKSSLRHSDLIFRMGGDEFSALILNVDNIGIRRLAEKVRKAVAGLTFKSDIKITTSIGGAIAQNEYEFNDLSDLADKALYKAKNKGRNFFHLS